MTIKYKLLVFDIDGTLLNDERKISKRTLAALLKVQQMGVRIVLASGRPTYGLMGNLGILHGGATLALAETVAGLGSMIICEPDEIVVGMQVSGNHISSAHEGDSVRAVGTILHKGRSSHIWNVDVFTSTNKLVSSVRVVNSVIKKR
ncbi:hotdog domain-containing protein [uncultured Bacteroides sp.]|uniref:PaaI family thioesterase n=1 Tax=uncultured Bacteroides sp. TaxID=162156 RepID=UPI00351AF021